MPDDIDDELMPILIGSNAIQEGEVREYSSFEEAVAALYASRVPGQIIDIHDEDCGLDVAGGEDSCTCTPIRLGGGAEA